MKRQRLRWMGDYLITTTSDQPHWAFHEEPLNPLPKKMRSVVFNLRALPCFRVIKIYGQPGVPHDNYLDIFRGEFDGKLLPDMERVKKEKKIEKNYQERKVKRAKRIKELAFQESKRKAKRLARLTKQLLKEQRAQRKLKRIKRRDFFLDLKKSQNDD